MRRCPRHEGECRNGAGNLQAEAGTEDRVGRSGGLARLDPPAEGAEDAACRIGARGGPDAFRDGATPSSPAIVWDRGVTLVSVLVTVAVFPRFGPTNPFDAVWGNTRLRQAPWSGSRFPALARIPSDAATQRIATRCGFLMVLRALWLLEEMVIPLPGSKMVLPIPASAVPALPAVIFWRRRAFGLMTVAGGADALRAEFRPDPWASVLRASQLLMWGIWLVGCLVRHRVVRHARWPTGSLSPVFPGRIPRVPVPHGWGHGSSRFGPTAFSIVPMSPRRRGHARCRRSTRGLPTGANTAASVGMRAQGDGKGVRSDDSRRRGRAALPLGKRRAAPRGPRLGAA